MDAVREADSERGRDVGVAGAEVQVPAGQTGVGVCGVVGTEARGLGQSLGVSRVPSHGDALRQGKNVNNCSCIGRILLRILTPASMS